VPLLRYGSLPRKSQAIEKQRTSGAEALKGGWSVRHG
jgi:hypothetical protein